MLHPRQRKQFWDTRQRWPGRLLAFQDRGRNLRRKKCQPECLVNDRGMKPVLLGELFDRLMRSVAKTSAP
jgi:hypothetical protein